MIMFISKGLWPPHLPDLNPYDFYLRETVMQGMYVNNPHMLHELKDIICIENKNSAMFLATFFSSMIHAS